MARRPRNPDEPLDDLANALDEDAEQLRELLKGEGLNMRMERIEAAQTADADEQLLRELTGNFRQPRGERIEELQPDLRPAGRFRITEADTMDGRHATKIIDGTTVAGTSIACFWTTTAPAADERRAAAVLVSELLTEVTTFTKITLVADEQWNITGNDTSFFTAGDNNPAPSHRTQVLCWVEAEHSCIAPAANRSAVMQCAVSMAGILQDRHAMSVSHLLQGFHVDLITIQMDRNYRFCLPGYRRFDL